MIPIRDINPSRTFPFVNYSIILACVFFFIFELVNFHSLKRIADNLGAIPVLYVSSEYHISFVNKVMRLITSLFLHGGIGHLVFNMWYLWIFGDNVEDKMGHIKYFLFYIFGGIFATFVHIFLHPHSTIPLIGASGAISAVMGAYLYYFPFARIITIVPMFIFFFFWELPAFFFLIIWFMFQFFSGMLSFALYSNVAFWAHIGGFLFGFSFAYVFSKKNNYDNTEII